MTREHRFELLEHTADVGVLGIGATKAEAFESAAYGMFSIVAEIDKYEPTGSRAVEASGADDITLLERFLSSLIVLFETEGALPVDFEITDISPGKLTCRVAVREIGDGIEWLGPTIKAVTYHQMAVDLIDGEWRARAIFDV